MTKEEAPRLARLDFAASPVRRRVAQVLREAIVNLTYCPGERLIERELCEATGVSRTSLREGLRELEAEGLVRNVPYKGLIVASVSADEARHIYDVRSQLEGLLGRHTASLRTETDLDALERNYDRIADVTASGSFGELVGLKGEFYAILMRVTANPILQDILVNLHGRVAQFRAIVMTREDRASESLREMRAILNAIAARDGDAAEAACIAHVRNAGDLVIEMLEDRTTD